MAVFFWLAATLAQIAAHASGEREREREISVSVCLFRYQNHIDLTF